MKSLLNHTFETINTAPTQIPILLEAPTGSGKTVMMASYLERIVEELPLIEVLVTATPRQRPQRLILISRQEVINEQMIKKGVWLNIGLDPAQQNGENVHIHLLRKAIQKKSELEALHDAELGENQVNPLLLIQLPSETESLIQFAEYYLNIFEFEARKLFLFPPNKALLIEHIAVALEHLRPGRTSREMQTGESKTMSGKYLSSVITTIPLIGKRFPVMPWNPSSNTKMPPHPKPNLRTFS